MLPVPEGLISQKNSKDLGIEINGNVDVNLKTIKARKDKIISDSRSGLEKMFGNNENISLIKGKAKFIDDSSVEVEGKIYEADKFYINVGGKARIHPVLIT